MSNFLIVRWHIGPTQIIFVTIVTPIEVVVAILYTISNIVILSVVIVIVPTFIFLT